MMQSHMMAGTFEPDYAGFWLRLVACIIDQLVIGLACLPVIGVMAFFIFNAVQKAGDGTDQTANAALGGVILICLCLFFLYNFVIWLVYNATMECTKQGTLGKLAIGLRVTDLDGNKISFLHAVGRNMGKFVSSIILYVGFMMAGFTDKKQCLHDMMSGTLVLRKSR